MFSIAGREEIGMGAGIDVPQAPNWKIVKIIGEKS
jgi:hypothetical protein